ncbi:MAG: 16S rRNA (cytosine1402-N4)-methyltransferase [bacterium]|nr:MAG: 16S rRNA (cytosine1402-N4)-methyltransferase [bacterium]
MRDESQGESVPPEIPLPAHALRGGRLRLVGRAMKPDAGECAANPRARSAVLRVAERTNEVAGRRGAPGGLGGRAAWSS